MTERRLQPLSEIEATYAEADPWGYESNPHDDARKQILLDHARRARPKRTLEIGCGHGFVTRDLPGDVVVGVDIAGAAIEHARRDAPPRVEYRRASIFDLPSLGLAAFDLVVVAGVLYDHYIGATLPLVYTLVDETLAPGGRLISVHIDSWYRARFPFRLLSTEIYPYREYLHRLEVYAK